VSADALTSATVEEGEMDYFDKIKPIDGIHTYKDDYAVCAFDQAKRFRALKSNDLDIVNLAEEIESVGKGEVNKSQSRLSLIMLHMLKWDHQPVFRLVSQENSISKSRVEVARFLCDNPSPKAILQAAIIDAFDDARHDA
jgi:hypothetical protein